MTSEQRYTIFHLHKEKCSLRSISKYIDVAPSTVSKELKRNRNERGKYYYQQAQLFARERHRWKQHPRKLKGKLQVEIEERSRLEQWSSEQIVGRYKLEGKAIASKTAIYNFLHRDKKAGGDLYRYCRHSLKHRRARLSHPISPKKARKSIIDRPEQVRMGDFEMDLIIGATPNEAIPTLTDRKTDFAIIEPLTLERKAKPLSKALIKRIAYLKRRGQIHSITTDNGSEFMAFDLIEKALKIPIYFSRPYKATDKAHIEQLNALIRQYLPKDISFKNLYREEITPIEQKLNTRPRKKLNFKTPIEVFLLNLS